MMLHCTRALPFVVPPSHHHHHAYWTYDFLNVFGPLSANSSFVQFCVMHAQCAASCKMYLFVFYDLHRHENWGKVCRRLYVGWYRQSQGMRSMVITLRKWQHHLPRRIAIWRWQESVQICAEFGLLFSHRHSASRRPWRRVAYCVPHFVKTFSMHFFLII